jgi:chemosensory pili system protein ChpC
LAERAAEIYSLLVPLVQATLIIPRACVAEVISFQAPSELPGAAFWCLGTVPWNDRAVPVVSFEGACGMGSAPASSGARIVVLHALAGILEGGQLAILSQGFPQQVRVSPEGVRADARRFHERVPVLCQIKMANVSPLVPDLERLEQMIAEETQNAM